MCGCLSSAPTPLSTAVFNSRGNGGLIRLLRRHGADPWHPNNTGHTPVGAARLIANYDVAQFFEDLTDSDPSHMYTGGIVGRRPADAMTALVTSSEITTPAFWLRSAQSHSHRICRRCARADGTALSRAPNVIESRNGQRPRLWP